MEKPFLKEWFIFPPYGVDIKESCNIYLKNVIECPNDFIQRTVKDVARISKYVSHSGDIWTYDMITGKSTTEHFD